MRFAVVARSPTLGARVRAVDDAAARAVARHLSGGDHRRGTLPDLGENSPKPSNGVAVVADSTWAALQAREQAAHRLGQRSGREREHVGPCRAGSPPRPTETTADQTRRRRCGSGSAAIGAHARRRLRATARRPRADGTCVLHGLVPGGSLRAVGPHPDPRRRAMRRQRPAACLPRRSSFTRCAWAAASGGASITIWSSKRCWCRAPPALPCRWCGRARTTCVTASIVQAPCTACVAGSINAAARSHGRRTWSTPREASSCAGRCRQGSPNFRPAPISGWSDLPGRPHPQPPPPGEQDLHSDPARTVALDRGSDQRLRHAVFLRRAGPPRRCATRLTSSSRCWGRHGRCRTTMTPSTPGTPVASLESCAPPPSEPGGGRRCPAVTAAALPAATPTRPMRRWSPRSAMDGRHLRDRAIRVRGRLRADRQPERRRGAGAGLGDVRAGRSASPGRSPSSGAPWCREASTTSSCCASTKRRPSRFTWSAAVATSARRAAAARRR